MTSPASVSRSSSKAASPREASQSCAASAAARCGPSGPGAGSSRSSSRRRVGAPSGRQAPRGLGRPPAPRARRVREPVRHCRVPARRVLRPHRAAVAQPQLGVLGGVETSRWTTQPSRPDASSQAPTRSVHVSPASVLPVAEQLSHATGARAPRRARGPARRPAHRRSAARLGTCRSGRSAPSVRGVMTNGGFDTTRSNASPRTGWSIDPARRSTSTPASAALNRRRRAHAATHPWPPPGRCGRACRAWIPDPVPRSSVRPRWSRTVRPASVAWRRRPPARARVKRRTGHARAEVRGHPPGARTRVVGERDGRRSTVATTASSCRSPAVATRPSRSRPSTPVCGTAAASARRGTRAPSRNARASAGSGSRRGPSRGR